MDFSMTHSHMTNRHSSISSNSGAWLNSFVNLFPLITYHFTQWVTGPLLLSSIFTLFLSCFIIFPMAALLCLLRLRIMTHFLTHIILHAGRIFRQWHRNCIVCLVIESALHVYKGQFSPWFGQFIIQTLLAFSYYAKLIQQNSSTLLPALYSLNARPPGLECL